MRVRQGPSVCVLSQFILFIQNTGKKKVRSTNPETPKDRLINQEQVSKIGLTFHCSMKKIIETQEISILQSCFRSKIKVV